MQEKEILQMKDACKYYKKRKVLENISFTVNKGGIYALVGQNGAGKTTIMRMITGLTTCSKGSCILNLTDKGKIGALIERPALYSNLTAKENIQPYAK